MASSRCSRAEQRERLLGEEGSVEPGGMSLIALELLPALWETPAASFSSPER